MRKRLRAEESGFTLVEVLVTMLMMLTVMFALYSIFDMSLRVFSFGNDKTEAVQNARVGMERMEREIRAAYPYDKSGQDGDVDEDLLKEHEPQIIAFGNDLNTNRQVDEGSDEEITYDLSGGSPPALLRNGSPAVEYVDDLTFEYLESDGTTETTEEEDMRMVSITLVIDVEGRTQTLNTDVSLRNRSG